MSPKGFTVHNVARLARLHLTEDEEQRLGAQFEQILGYIDKLDELDTKDVEPTSHVLQVQNVFRDDQVQPDRFGDGEYLPLSPSHHKGHYEVPQIIG